MHSDRSEFGHRRQHGDRSTRPWDDYGGRWEERRETRRDAPQDRRYGGDAPGCAERTSRGREYSDSPKTLTCRDSGNWERVRKSPPRRRVSSPDWSISERKRRRFTEDDEDNYRYRREPEDQMYRQSPDTFPRTHFHKDFKHVPQQEEDFKHRKLPQDSRKRHRHDELMYKQQHEDVMYRRSSGYYKDRDGNERSRGRSQDHNTKNYAKTRERNESPSTDHKHYHQNATRFPMNGYGEQSFERDGTNQSPAVPEEKSGNGFQRFLDVLNKGVNVNVLTQIVTQTPPGAERPLSPGSSGWRQRYARTWGKAKEPHRPASPQQLHGSSSLMGGALSTEPPPQRISDEGRGCFGSNSRSRSPSVAEKTPMTPEDEHKHRQMQDVLQAIGMDLGFEELGQMSHRIQERLYGKKDGDSGRQCKESRERETRVAFSPKPQSRPSPSSRSSFSPLTQDFSLMKDSCVFQSDEAELLGGANSTQKSGGGGSLQDTEKHCESSVAFQTISQNAAHAVSEPAAMPAYSLYPPPALPPALPRVGPGFFLPGLPGLPPFLPFPCVPPLNILPAMLSQTQPLGYCLPPNLPNLNPVKPLNTSTLKSKTLPRPRCLQVIETKQPG